jgi:hypothetical protein
MDMGRVVPVARERGGGTVEEDAAAHEHEPFHEPLDGTEFVRDIEDRRAELDVELLEQLGEGVLSFDVHPRGRLVEDDEVGLSGERLRDVGALALPARETVNGDVGTLEQADALNRSANSRSIRRCEGADKPSARDASGRYELPNGHGSLDPEERPLRQIAQANAILEAVGRLAEEEGLARRRPLQPEDEADERGLSASVRAGDADKLAQWDDEVDAPEHGRAAWVRKR